MRLPCPLAAFEPANPASERPQTQSLDHAATAVGKWHSMYFSMHDNFSATHANKTDP